MIDCLGRAVVKDGVFDVRVTVDLGCDVSDCD